MGGALPAGAGGVSVGTLGGGSDENAPTSFSDENGRHVLGENNSGGNNTNNSSRSPSGLGGASLSKKGPLARLGSLGSSGDRGKESKLYSHENGVVTLKVGKESQRGCFRVLSKRDRVEPFALIREQTLMYARSFSPS